MLRWDRRLPWIAGVAAGLLLTGAGAIWLLRSIDATGSPSLPRHLGGPGVSTPDGRRSPLGAASVAFSGQHSLDEDADEYTVTVAGARKDRYRSLPVGSIAGLSAVLSPDGRRLAVEDGIVDLTTGALSRLPGTQDDVRRPEAWSPDGRYLAIVEYAYAGAVTPQVARATLSVMDTSTGHATAFGDVTDTNTFDGWVAAFSPVGDIAYQVGTSIHVAGPTGTPIRTLSIPEGTRIAGKGAWTTDGEALAVVAESPCGCGRPWDARWELSTVSVATGDRTGVSYAVDGVIAVRMLGWAGGRPVVQAFEPGSRGADDPGDRIVDFRPHDPDADDGYDYMNEVENLDEVYGSRLLLLTPGGAPRTLVSTGDQAESVDVADVLVPEVVTGPGTRNGYPPLVTDVRLVEAGALLALVALLARTVAVIRRTARRRRTPAPVTAPPLGPAANA